MRKINKFLKLQNVTKCIHEIPMCQLDELLAMFILSIRKEDGEEYETTSIWSFISSIERELQHHNYPFTVGKGERQGFPWFHETCAVSSHSPVLMYTCKFITLFKKCFIYQIINFFDCNKMKNYCYSSTSFWIKCVFFPVQKVHLKIFNIYYTCRVAYKTQHIY